MGIMDIQWILTSVVVIGVAWGVMKATMKSLEKDLKKIEANMDKTFHVFWKKIDEHSDKINENGKEIGILKDRQER